MTIRTPGVTAFLCLAIAVGCAKRSFNEPGKAALKTDISSGKTRGLDVNDVSVLFPFPNDVTQLGGLLKISQPSSTDGIPLITDEQFKQITDAAIAAKIDMVSNNFTGASDQPLLKKDNWRVVSFRYDPCAPFLQPPSTGGALPATCRPQIRLVAQPFVVDGSNVNVDDYTIHIVYEFTPAESKQQAIDLLKLKVDNKLKTDGRPLGVHPSMPNPSDLNLPVAQAFRRYLVGHLQSAKLSVIAFMGLAPAPEPWRFFAGAMIKDASGKINFRLLNQKFPANKANGFQDLIFIGNRKTPVEPDFMEGAKMERPHTAPLFNKKDLFDDKSDGIDPIETIVNVDNPQLSGLAPGKEFDLKNKKGQFLHRDCVSCHTSTSRALDLALVPRTGERDSNAFKSLMSHADAFKPEVGITGWTMGRSLQVGNWNVRNFGYLFGEPAVAIRTLNETAEVAAFTNKHILGDHANPSPFNCAGKEAEVWKCVVSDSDTNSFDACMKLCTVIKGATAPVVAAVTTPVAAATKSPRAPAAKPGDAPAKAAPGTKNGVCVTDVQTFVYTEQGFNMGDVGPATTVNTDGLLHDVKVGGKVIKMIRVLVDEKFTVGTGISSLPKVGGLRQGFIDAAVCLTK